MFVLRWPKTRPLTDETGRRWAVGIGPGRIVLASADGDDPLLFVFADPDELRALAMQLHAAAIDLDGATQEAAVKASLDRRRARGLGGHRHRPVEERPEPPMHMEVPA